MSRPRDRIYVCYKCGQPCTGGRCRDCYREAAQTTSKAEAEETDEDLDRLIAEQRPTMPPCEWEPDTRTPPIGRVGRQVIPTTKHWNGRLYL